MADFPSEWDDLLKAQEYAVREGLGIHNKSEKKEQHVRRIKEITNPSEHFEKLKKAAVTGGMINVIMLRVQVLWSKSELEA